MLSAVAYLVVIFILIISACWVISLLLFASESDQHPWPIRVLLWVGEILLNLW